jgi:excisionase family DNA binding protein
MQVDSTRLYRVRDVAEHFDVSVATIYRAIESGHLKALKLGTGTGTFRVTGAAIRAYAEACVRAAYRSWLPDEVPADLTGERIADLTRVGHGSDPR